MNSPACQKPENISLFPACQPPPRLLKAKLVTEIDSFIMNLVWPGQAGWRIEKLNPPSARRDIARPGIGPAARNEWWFATRAPQDAAGISFAFACI
jgi:hypothetical protein